MNDLICVDATFTPKQLEFWKLHGVVHPELNKIYQIREVVRHANSRVGVRLEGLNNPKIPVKHTVLSKVMLEPSWKLQRFRTLQGNIINEKEILEEIKEKV